jgi:thiol-disulfide isomerase/thioredoxin
MAPGRRDFLTFGAIAAAAAAAGGIVGALALQSASGAADLLAASFPDLSGRPRRLIEWKGQTLACNFWATWCLPCREEVLILDAARQQYASKGFEIVGIGIDNASKIREFAAIYALSYPIVVADASAIALMRKLGNAGGGLPYTVFIDRDGAVARRKLGPLSRTELQAILDGLLR